MTCRGVARGLLFRVCAAAAAAAARDNCFVPLPAPLSSTPFDDSAVRVMRERFFKNINVDGTGAVVAAAGAVPALRDCCPGGYTYHWERDGALSMMALQELVDIDGDGDEAAFAREALEAYVGWVRRQQQSNKTASHLEPKWNISSGQPYAGGWCRPQTDGPPLRALTLMRAARWVRGPSRDELWKLVRFDLDWLSWGFGSIKVETCDLWEETTDSDFYWNRVVMRAALAQGYIFATMMGDDARAWTYRASSTGFIGDPATDHTSSDGFLTECPSSGGGASCRDYAKSIDSAVILSLIHSHGLDPSPRSVVVARTVHHYNELFCRLYPVNRRDSANNVPGVLYGRYENDVFGGGNPWVLLTASLASLLYQAAQQPGPPTPGEVEAWAAALNSSGFDGSAAAFVAAGDAVLARLAEHVAPEGFRLFEQIDRNSGRQYNAEDLTWSYAETLSALREREAARGLPLMV